MCQVRSGHSGFLDRYGREGLALGPEMREVSRSLAAAVLPPEMAEAAATVFDSGEQGKDDQNFPLSQLLASLKDN